jgi:phospholipase C
MRQSFITIKKRVLSYAAMGLMVSGALFPAFADETARPKSPIEHVIIIVGENHTFDNLFGAYQPVKDQKIHNLLSEGIIKEDGSPGIHFSDAAQQKATIPANGLYSINPPQTGAYTFLPQPNTTYATGLTGNVPDPRFPSNLPNGPFQITKFTSYGAYLGDPPHRFFQMWQQYDTGKLDLFPWVDTTASIGPSNDGFSPSPTQPNQGGEAMGFYNMSTGDVPIFKNLADHYAMSDNYHQSIMGGTGANFIAIATADVAYYTDANGKPAVPPTSVTVGNTVVSQIENPNPNAAVFSQTGNPNWYLEDGYRGGSYVKCSDMSQPGVAPIMNYLKSLHVNGNCAKERYYILNNYGTGYSADGTPVDLTLHPFTVPPQVVPTLAELLSAHHVTWKYYTGGRNSDGTTTNEYCNICDPFAFSKPVMTSALKNNLQGMDQFNQDVMSPDTLPAVSFIRPFEKNAGHPANATMPDFESFVAGVIGQVMANPEVWSHTAILITTDEGGGYYDSGFIQPVDFFGDGTRIPFIAVSPFAKNGYIDHTYYDHASIAKFIEANWELPTLSGRSRDNLPNPRMGHDDHRYIPQNQPAIGDLMNLFDFSHK